MTVFLVLPMLLSNFYISNEPFQNMPFGLRSRRPMKRTTSMTILGLDLSEDGGGTTRDARSPFFVQEGFDRRMLPETISPRNPRRYSADFLSMEAVSTAQYFLGTCCLCKLRLIPGRDIYMYKGDSAFCSHECRQQQMKQDERKEKCSLSASVQQVPSSAATATSRMNVTAEGETVAAI